MWCQVQLMLTAQVCLTLPVYQTVEHTEQVIQENRRVTTDEAALELDISHGPAHHIKHNIFQYHKVCARWVSRKLTAELKEWHMDAVKNFWGVIKLKGMLFFSTQ
jgi:hypothetical protein